MYQTLNPYLNQRHLVVALAVAVTIINVPLHPIVLGLIIGLLYKIHSLIAISTFIVVLFYKRKVPVLALLIWAIFILLERSPAPPVSLVLRDDVLQYWWMNAGVSLILLPIGVYLAPRKAKLLFFSFLPLFVIANTVKLSFRIEHNHSLINFFWISVSLFVAFALVKIFDKTRVIAVVLFVLLISSGILNLMAVKNDYQAYFSDGPQWIKKNTAPDAIFLTTRSLYDPATLAGRFTYVGPSYYLEVMGIDYQEREQFATDFYKDPQLLAQEARERGIDYVIFSDGSIHPL